MPRRTGTTGTWEIFKGGGEGQSRDRVGEVFAIREFRLLRPVREPGEGRLRTPGVREGGYEDLGRSTQSSPRPRPPFR